MFQVKSTEYFRAMRLFFQEASPLSVALFVSLLIIITSFPAFSQATNGVATVTYSGQGAAALKAETGKRIAGFQLVSVIVCSPATAGVSVAGGNLYAGATKAGFNTIDADPTYAIIMHTSSIDWRNLAPKLIGDAATAGALFTSGGIISANSSWVTALIASHGLMDMAGERLKTYAPDPGVVVGKLIKAQDTIALPPNQCTSGYIGAQFSKPVPQSTVLISAQQTTTLPVVMQPAALPAKQVEITPQPEPEVAPEYDYTLAAHIVAAHVRALEARSVEGSDTSNGTETTGTVTVRAYEQ